MVMDFAMDSIHRSRRSEELVLKYHQAEPVAKCIIKSSLLFPLRPYDKPLHMLAIKA